MPTAASTRSSTRSSSRSSRWRRALEAGRLSRASYEPGESTRSARSRPMIIRKSQAEIDGMARAGALLSETLAVVAEHLEPGIEMRELDRIADEHIAARGGKPTSKGYKGFPAALCISPNSMVVHGIPGDYRAREGDLISVDLGITLDGLVADSAVTLPVGEISSEAQRLLDVCREALDAGIEQARVGNHLSDISHAIQIVVEGAGFSVVRSLVGHGVGRSYHEDPQIPNYGPPGRGPLLQEGMTLAIEPMITAGEPDVYVTPTNGRSPPSTSLSQPTSSTPLRSLRTARAC